jgi:Cdc6-like AAA superfamily ATPase
LETALPSDILAAVQLAAGSDIDPQVVAVSAAQDVLDPYDNGERDGYSTLSNLSLTMSPGAKMTQADYIKALLRAHTDRDESGFREAADQLAADEERKGHRLLARDLRRMLDGGLQVATMPRPRTEPDVPCDSERGLPLATVLHPEDGLESVILPDGSRETLRLLVEDVRAREQFASWGLPPKRKVLFFGPPGCGKTVTALAVAGELSLPLLYVRFDALISSYLGETAANMRRLFDFAQARPWVVLFDEFDAIGKSRDDPSEHGELKRVISSLLQMMDGMRGASLLIAATNHEHMLDNALWRRFDEILRFEPPGQHERIAQLRKYLLSFQIREPDLRRLAADTEGLTGGDLERVAVDAAKQAVLSVRREVDLDDLMAALARQRQRMAMAAENPD